MSQPDPSSVARIAIAFAALKFKPRDQSIASYLLDLQSCFPLTTKDDNNGEWRMYALELEKQLASLKAQWDASQELLSKLPRDASQAVPISDAPPKKKSKKNPAKDQHDLEWSWEQTRADWSRFLSSQHPSSPSLVAAYASVNGVLASPNADLSHAARLTDAISRALTTMHVFLFSAPNPNPDHVQTALGAPLRPDPQYIDCARIAMASPLLMYLLRIALPALLHVLQGDSTRSKRQRQRVHPAAAVLTDAYVHVDSVLDRLLERVLLPLLCALAPLCTARLAPLVTPLPKKASQPIGKGKRRDKGKDKDERAGAPPVRPPKIADVRTDVFALIGASLEALDALPALVCPSGAGGIDLVSRVAVDIRARLGLEVIRELEALYAVSSLPPSSSEPSSESSQRPPPATPSEAPPAVPLCTPPLARGRPWTQSRTAAESLAKRLERLAGTREERVRTLATRDAGWFLASTLNLCVTPAPAPTGPGPSHCDLATKGSEHPGELLREALLDRVGYLVRVMPPEEYVSDGMRDGPHLVEGRTSKPKLAIDPICRNMLLAACERAMMQLAPCT